MAITRTTTLTAVLCALSGVARGHMVMNTPTPYNYHGASKLVQVNPLGESFPFPCQGAFDVVSTTQITAGTTQLVNFTGGAQHGGGSCQFGLTYANPPSTDKSKFKTIYTLIGGCPVDAAGNLPVTGTDQDGRADSVHCGNDSGKECIRQFEIPIPKELPNGDATFVWSWFNEIGNREMYMNCAPVTITGGSGDDTSFLDGLEDMFVANIPGECTTGPGILNIPNPGKYGKVLKQPTPGSEGSCPKAAGIPTFEGDNGSGSGSGSGSGNGGGSDSSVIIRPPSSSSTSATSAPAASSPASAQPNPVETSTSDDGGVSSNVRSPLPTAAPIPTPTAGSDSGVGIGRLPCSGEEGSLVCFSPTSFGLCANGMAIPQPVAPGTTCTNGKIVRRGLWSAKFTTVLMNRHGDDAF
ncbi:uncharacterized protein B0T15DRAFT_560900 [Chaetomium strumarium]|uniref:Lytic polysaccharide monooxygenase n=1 Tax=Chaetomium strumarium TaxID=1170767 RepID=A0AAJ0LZV8_9PEZI|nr:hypothetical protein B0T15DRAFT_560900 [Chaetomium strumarium]